GLARRAYGMRAGRLAQQSDVTHGRARRIEVDVDGASFNVDGEVCRCQPARFTLRAGGFEVVVT
nr:hypothetical protein [Solirubrobacterales bacterium]